MPEQHAPACPADAVAAYRKRLSYIVSVTDVLGARHSDALPTAATILFEDTIAELKTAEDALRSQSDALLDAKLEVEARGLEFQLLFEHAPVAYMVTDLYGTLRDANLAGTRLLARRKNALVGKPLIAFVRLADRTTFRSAISRAAAGAAPREWGFRLRRDDGPDVDVIAIVAAGPTNSATRTRGTLYWIVYPRGARTAEAEDLL